MSSSVPSVGFVGLGNMGHGMARNLLKAGYPLTVLAHRRRVAVDDLVREGAEEAANVGELAESCDIVILCVATAEQVDTLVRGREGIGACARAGTTVVDVTTSAPRTILALARDFPDLVFVDAPLGRSPKEALSGSLSVMVGCSEERLAALRPLLTAFATTIQHAGPLGAGHTLKLINNMISMGYAALFAEALVLARASGVGTDAVDELISSSRMNCEFFQSFMGWSRDGDATTHPFSLALANHTVLDALTLSDAHGLDLGVLEAVSALFTRAVEDDFGSANLPELPRAVACSLGVRIEPLRAPTDP